MFESFSERAKRVRLRNRAALIFGHGFLESGPLQRKQLLTVMAKGLPDGKTKRDVLLASNFENIELDGPYLEQRQVVVEEYNSMLRKREEGKALKKAEMGQKKMEEERQERERQEFERWKASRKTAGDGEPSQNSGGP